MDLPTGFGPSLGQGLKKGSPVNIVEEDGGFAIATAHDVVNGAMILDPQFSGHGRVACAGQGAHIILPRATPEKDPPLPRLITC